MATMHNPPHPGEVLREWLTDISVTDAAERLGVARVSLSRLLNGATGVSAEMDLRLAKALGTTPGSWLSMQVKYDLWHAQKKFKAKVKPIIASATNPRSARRSSAATIDRLRAPTSSLTRRAVAHQPGFAGSLVRAAPWCRCAIVLIAALLGVGERCKECASAGNAIPGRGARWARVPARARRRGRATPPLPSRGRSPA